MRFPRFSPNKVDGGSSAQKSTQEAVPHQEGDEALALAHAIHGAGMAGVASFALHMLKPLHWMGGQALWMLQPFVESLGVGYRRETDGAISTARIAHLLEKEGGLDDLVLHLERLQSEDGGARR